MHVVPLRPRGTQYAYKLSCRAVMAAGAGAALDAAHTAHGQSPQEPDCNAATSAQAPSHRSDELGAACAARVMEAAFDSLAAAFRNSPALVKWLLEWYALACFWCLGSCIELHMICCLAEPSSMRLRWCSVRPSARGGPAGLDTCRLAPHDPAAASGAQHGKRLFDRELPNRHAEPLVLAQLAARTLRTLGEGVGRSRPPATDAAPDVMRAASLAAGADGGERCAHALAEGFAGAVRGLAVATEAAQALQVRWSP